MIDVLMTNQYGLIYGNDGNDGGLTHSSPEKHKHTYQHIIIGLNDVFTVSIGAEEKTILCTGIIIDSNVLHTVTLCADTLIYLVDKTTTIASQISTTYFKEDVYYVLPDSQVDGIRQEWDKYLNNNGDMLKASERILELCQINPEVVGKTDERITKVLEIIERSEGIYEGFVDDLAMRCGLSKSRFCHLFKEQMGMSITSYLLCSKIFKAYHYNFSGMNMTESAVRAGFNSLSHFSETHKKMFGYSLSGYKPYVNIHFR
ncbi:MAG: helix-turn-helix domain-containing protein [Lachnospiraceae bacterium]